MATPIIPAPPINIPGNIVAPSTEAGTGLSFFVPDFVNPPNVPPNADVVSDQNSGDVQQTIAPGLVAVGPGLANVTVLPPV